MTNATTATIRTSSQFFGKYEVVLTNAQGTQEVIPCHNLSTARSYVEGTREYAIVNRHGATRDTQPTIDCVGFCSPSGQYYAVVEMPDMDVRIDCHNASTLRGWMKNGLPFQTLMDAFKDAGNVRRSGGWHA